MYSQNRINIWSKPSKNLQWYVVHTQTGYEARAKASIESRVKEKGFEDHFGEVLIPTENVVELVKGQKQTTAQKFFPGYIFVHMNLNQRNLAPDKRLHER